MAITSVPKPSLTVQELLSRGAMGGLDESGMIALARHWRTLFALGTPEANDTAVGQLAQVAGRSLDRLLPPGTFACRKGCGHCCNFHVGLFAPEAFRIARQLRKTPAVAPRLAETAAKVVGFAPLERPRQRIPCALLVRDACSIHPWRPHSCRVFMSIDVADCLASLVSPAARSRSHPVHDDLETRIGLSFLAGLRAAGRFAHAYELNAILARLLADPGLEARWYAGEDVFADLADGMIEAATGDDGPLADLVWHAGRD